MTSRKQNQIWLVFPLVIILVVSLACGSSPNTGVKVGEVGATQTVGEPANPAATAQPADASNPAKSAQPTEASGPTNTPKPQNMIYKVGDVVEASDHLIAMYGAQYKGDMLIAKFILANTGKDEIAVSSMMSFSAKNSDGTKLDQELMDCGGSFDGSVAAGDKLKGQICWTGAQPGAKVYYSPSLFGSGAIVWEIPETVADKDVVFPGLTDLGIKQEVFKVGDLIDAKDHYIVLTGAEYKGGVLIASFLVGNNGASDITISSMMSFSAKKPSGEKLDQEIMDCGANFDGTVVPGDKMKGQICWKNAEAGTKIYYDASLFSAGMIIWDVPQSTPPVTKDYPEISSLSIKQKTYNIGDIVDVRSHKITLNTLTMQNGILKANFTINNDGTEDVNVSSMLSFSARNPDGTDLSLDIFNCGSSLDGKVIPGDKLKGDICWKGAQPGAHVYYDASLFSSGMVIWTSK